MRAAEEATARAAEEATARAAEEATARAAEEATARAAEEAVRRDAAPQWEDYDEVWDVDAAGFREEEDEGVESAEDEGRVGGGRARARARGPRGGRR